jgi:hypothetical protein
MAETRYHELLGLAPEIQDPDYYQLLILDRADVGQVEVRFKAQMTRLQQIENPKHKEFIEFLKGELKRARGVLSDPSRRKEYDKQIAEERAEELRKILSHMLIDGVLSDTAEKSVEAEGRNLGLDPAAIKRVIDGELERSGAKRVAAKGAEPTTQAISDERAGALARDLQEARLQARIAQSRSMVAELRERKASEEAELAVQKAKQAQVLARKAINAEHVAAAQAGMEAANFEQKAKKLADESLRVAAQLEEARSAVAGAQAAIAATRGSATAASRLILTFGVVIVLFVGIQAAKELAGEAMAGVVKGLKPAEDAMGRRALVGAAVALLAVALVAGYATARTKAFWVFGVLSIAAAAASSLLL